LNVISLSTFSLFSYLDESELNLQSTFPPSKVIFQMESVSLDMNLLSAFKPF
jgi:hypothetical protein